MKSTKPSILARRRFFQQAAGLASATGMSALAARSGLAQAAAGQRAQDPRQRKLLFVLCASGGGCIVDSFLPVLESEVENPETASRLNVYPERLIGQPANSQLRCVLPLEDTSFYTNSFPMDELLMRHAQDMAVVTQEVTSVNHAVGQKRAMTGAGINRGRTICEAVADVHGLGLPLANVNMGNGGYVEPGNDRSLATHARPEIIADPMMFAMSTHGSRGLLGSPSEAALARARSVRAQLDQNSAFAKTFAASPRLQNYLKTRAELAPELERLDLISKLMMLPPSQLPSEFGLSTSPLAHILPPSFPQLQDDHWQQQAALAFLMSYYGLSCASTLALRFDPVFDGNEIVGTPLSFDFSHNSHRIAQNVMWGRTCKVLDGLISLLKATDYMGDPSLGKMWDRSLIYVATEFGRDKKRPAGQFEFGTSHHLNNGVLLVSPLLKGNRVYGGVDPNTLLTYGFDGATGAARPGTVMREGDVYSIIAQAMGVDFAGRRDMSGLLRA